MINSMSAHKQWMNRPDDERYLTLQSLHAACLKDRDTSIVEFCDNKDLEARATDDGDIRINTPNHDALALNHWTFGQLAQAANSPAGYLKKLHPSLAADCINWGIQRLSTREAELLYLGSKEMEIEARGMTSPSYGRIYNSEVSGALQFLNMEEWKIPSASYQSRDPLRATTLYKGDRNMFVFLVNEKNPISFNGKNIFRGFMTWNSEVGAETFGFATFTYDYVCDNRIVWGMDNVRELRIRHTSGAPERFIREAQPILSQYVESSALKAEDTLRRASSMLIGENDDDVKKFLANRQFNKGQIDSILNRAYEEEGGARTKWQVVQGITAYARSIPHQDDRVAVERAAGKILEECAA